MKYSHLFKKSVIFSIFFFFFSWGIAQAFLFDLKPQDKAAIHQLQDDKLINTYINVMIELEAANEFFNNSGLNLKEYNEYKALLRYRTDLILEIQKRKLKIPRIQ